MALRALYQTVPKSVGFRWVLSRALSSTIIAFKKPMPPRPKVNEDDIEEKFLKGSGPGGQKSKTLGETSDFNKTSSAVQLRHIPTGIVVKSQETRSREQNRKIARQLLASRLEDIDKGDESRNNVLKTVAKKKKASKRKKSLRKYRALDEAKRVAGAEAAGLDGLEGDFIEDEGVEEEDEDDDDSTNDGDKEQNVQGGVNENTKVVTKDEGLQRAPLEVRSN